VRVRRPVLSVVLLLGLIGGGCSEHPPASPTPTSSPPGPSKTPAPHPTNRVAAIREQHLLNVKLTTHEGRSVRFYDDLVKGKVVAINFMFTTCGNSCPLSTAHLVETQKLLGEHAGRDITFLSITMDPEHDTPSVLHAYAKAYGVGPGWYFLTGAKDDIERLRRKLGVYDLDPIVDADRNQHSGVVVLGNEPRGRWKAVTTLSKPVRIRQAIERTILPPNKWPRGAAVVNEVPYEVRDVVEPVDLSALPRRD
jgi:protein SCO1/2